MILDLDIGNSRISCLLSHNTGHGIEKATGHATSLEELTSSIDAAIQKYNQAEGTQDKIEEIRVACVLQDEKKKQKLLKGIEKHWQVSPRLAKSQKKHKQLKIAYDDASTFGVDRWLALLAARHISGITSDGDVICVPKGKSADVPKHQMIIDAGTAVSMDVLEGTEHEGGLLIPGNQVIKDAFISRTGLELESDRFSEVEAKDAREAVSLGVDSQSCLDAGVDSMVTLYIQYKIAEFFKRRPWGRILVTGGGGSQFPKQFEDLRAQHDPMPMPNAEIAYIDCLVCYGLEYADI